MVHEFEALWSRFRSDSEVSFVNASAGRPCRVSSETTTLFERAEFARQATRGAFNPLVLGRLERLGYGPAERRSTHPLHTEPLPDASIDVIIDAQMVCIPPGTGFDPGGIGKGLTADFVVERLVALGATTVQVELGGDVRVHGPHWADSAWTVEVCDPSDRRSVIARLSVDEGALATSSVLGTTWEAHGDSHHHLIDASTGLPAITDLVSVTATSSELWWAEVVAKVAVMAGSADAPGIMRQHGCAGLMVDARGDVQAIEVAEEIRS
jgi:thiamine biosynthesis lipoprotein